MTGLFMHHSNRREFLKTGMRAGVALAGFASCGTASLRAIEPIKRSGAPRLMLSLAAYSFRDYFKDASHQRATEPDPAKRADQSPLHRAVEFGIDGVGIGIGWGRGVALFLRVSAACQKTNQNDCQ
jgi:hypothetical protein